MTSLADVQHNPCDLIMNKWTIKMKKKKKKPQHIYLLTHAAWLLFCSRNWSNWFSAANTYQTISGVLTCG